MLRSASSPLAGTGVAVTRPREQAARLAALLEEAGARALLFPAIEIADPEDPDSARAVASRLATFDLAIFVSPTAVQRATRFVRGWPPGLAAGAVGPGTAAELRRLGFAPVLVPDAHAGTDSEALLARPELAAMAGRRVALFRGEGGRALLAETLAARGATVEHAVCYRRVRPGADPAPLLAAWRSGALHAVTVSSSEGVENLHALLGADAPPVFHRTPFFAAHARIAERARALGARAVFESGPADEEVRDRLVAYFADHE